MSDLSSFDITKEEALQKAKEFFNNEMQFVALLERNMDPNVKTRVEWLVNTEILLREYENVPYFDESLRYEGPCYHIVGGKSKQHPLAKYQRVFPRLRAEDVAVVEGAGHWVHFDKPLETIKLIGRFLEQIDHIEEE
jgi:pimeloyl-ACP methyl ester carboxylesterase